MKTQLINIVLLLILLLSITACDNHTEIKEKTMVSALPGGYRINVKKIDSYTTQTGALTGLVYGKSHSYSYQFTLSPGRIFWNGGSDVPQEIILCSKETFVHYLRLDSQGKPEEKRFVIQSHYDKHVDNRYFFKLLGDQFWITDTDHSYKTSTDCKNSDIPNDKELTKA